ncbi:MAG: hypothetical protein PHX51_08380, partial [Clostridia bacterium]|nr:hypothetical protein [Clostridia bacterium]
ETQKKAGIVLTGIFDKQTSNKMLGFAREYAVTSPATFDDIINMIKGFGLNPKTKNMIDKSQDLPKTLRDLSYLTIGLGATKPEQGVKGASYAMREAMAGQFISLRRRFEIMPEAVAAAGNTSLSKMQKDPLEFLRSPKAYLDLHLGENTLKNLSMTYEVQINNIKDFIAQAEAMIGENGFYGTAMTLATRVAEAFKMIIPTHFFKEQLKEISNSLSDFATVYVEGTVKMINNMFEPLKKPEIAELFATDPTKARQEFNYYNSNENKKQQLMGSFRESQRLGDISKNADPAKYIQQGLAVSHIFEMINLALFGMTLILAKVQDYFAKLFGGWVRDAGSTQKAIEQFVEHIWKVVKLLLDVFTKVLGIAATVVTTINDMNIGTGFKTMLLFFTAFPIASANMVINTMRFFGESLLMVFNPTVTNSMGRILSHLSAFAGAGAGYAKALLSPSKAFATANALSYVASPKEMQNSWADYKSQRLGNIDAGNSPAEFAANRARVRAELAAQAREMRQARDLSLASSGSMGASFLNSIGASKQGLMTAATNTISFFGLALRYAGAAVLGAALIAGITDGLSGKEGTVFKGLEKAAYRILGGLKNFFDHIIPDSFRGFVDDIVKLGGIGMALFPFQTIAIISSFGSALMAAIFNPISLGIIALAAFMYSMDVAAKKLRSLSGEKDANEIAADMLKKGTLSKASYIYGKEKDMSFSGVSERLLLETQAAYMGTDYKAFSRSKWGADVEKGLSALKPEDEIALEKIGYKRNRITGEYTKPNNLSRDTMIPSFPNAVKEGVGFRKANGAYVIGADMDEGTSIKDIMSNMSSGYENLIKKPEVSGVVESIKSISNYISPYMKQLADSLGFKEEDGKKLAGGMKETFFGAETAVKEGGEKLVGTAKEIRQKLDMALVEATGKGNTEKKLLTDIMNIFMSPEIKAAMETSDKFFKKDKETQKEELRAQLVAIQQAKKDMLTKERDLELVRQGFEINIFSIDSQIVALKETLQNLVKDPWKVSIELSMSGLQNLNVGSMLGGAVGAVKDMLFPTPKEAVKKATTKAEKSDMQLQLDKMEKGVRGAMAGIDAGGANKALETEKKYFSEKKRMEKEILEAQHQGLEASMEAAKYEAEERIKAVELDFKGTKHYEEMKTLVTRAEAAKRIKAEEDSRKAMYEKVLSNKWANPDAQMRAYDYINNIEKKGMNNDLEYMRKQKLITEQEFKQMSGDYNMSKEVERLEKQYDILKNKPKISDILGGKEAEKIFDSMNTNLLKYTKTYEQHLSLRKDGSIKWDNLGTDTTKTASPFGTTTTKIKTSELSGKITGSFKEAGGQSLDVMSAMKQLQDEISRNSLNMLLEEINQSRQLSEYQIQRLLQNQEITDEKAKQLRTMRDLIAQAQILAQVDEQYWKDQEAAIRKNGSIQEQFNFAWKEQVRKMP